jgi:heme/copper-type cytochrome/quinol oxidase subunit 2
MNLLVFGYFLIPIALVVMFTAYRPVNWIWFCLLMISLFIGVAPFVAIVYLLVYFRSRKKQGDTSDANSRVTYHPDGSYTVYKAANTSSAPSAGKMAFRIVGGILAAASVLFGLLIVAFIIFVVLAPSSACGGSSKGC